MLLVGGAIQLLTYLLGQAREKEPKQVTKVPERKQGVFIQLGPHKHVSSKSWFYFNVVLQSIHILTSDAKKGHHSQCQNRQTDRHTDADASVDTWENIQWLYTWSKPPRSALNQSTSPC